MGEAKKPTKKKVTDFHPGDVVEFKIRGVVVPTFTRMVSVKVDQLPYVGTLPVPPGCSRTSAILRLYLPNKPTGRVLAPCV